MDGVLFAVCGQKFLLQFGKECVMIKITPQIQRFSQDFKKLCEFDGFLSKSALVKTAEKCRIYNGTYSNGGFSMRKSSEMNTNRKTSKKSDFFEKKC